MKSSHASAIRGIAALVVGTLLFGLGEYAGITLVIITEADWILNVFRILTGVILGAVAGLVLGRRWYLSIVCPVLYYGWIASTIRNPRLMWLEGMVLIVALAVMLSAYMSRTLHTRRAAL